jgi:hypothetical protein
MFLYLIKHYAMKVYEKWRVTNVGIELSSLQVVP